MDDDDFGGFEAAETFDGEQGGNQAVSPAVPWATFPAVSGVRLSPASPELILDHDHSSPSTGHLPPDAVISSADDTHADSSLMSQTISKAQIQQSAHTHLNIPLFPLGLTDEPSHGALALEDEPEGPGVHVSNSQLRQKISSLETKLKASEEEKQRIKKDVESLMEKHSVLDRPISGSNSLLFYHEEKGFLKEIQEALTQQSQEQKESLEKCLQEEMQRNKETLESAVKLEKEAMKDVITKAVGEERENLEKVHAEERELWKTEHARDQERVAEAIQAAVQEQQRMSQEAVKAAIVEEQRRSEKAMEEAVKRTRDELVEYVREQRRLDQVTRQRSLSSLELFLSCAQKQLSALIATEPVDIE